MGYINKEKWANATDEKKAKVICDTLSFPTHNGITKDDFLLMLDWVFHQVYSCDKVCSARISRSEELEKLKEG